MIIRVVYYKDLDILLELLADIVLAPDNLLDRVKVYYIYNNNIVAAFLKVVGLGSGLRGAD